MCCVWQETRCFDALAELYGMLNEEDVLFGLWKRRGAAEETRAALSCIQHGVLQPGQDYLLDAIRKAANNQYPPMSAGQLPFHATAATCKHSHVRMLLTAAHKRFLQHSGNLNRNDVGI
jgi:hypothetical protein